MKRSENQLKFMPLVCNEEHSARVYSIDLSPMFNGQEEKFRKYVTF